MELIWQDFPHLVIVAPTQTAVQVLSPLATNTGQCLWCPGSIQDEVKNLSHIKIYQTDLKTHLQAIWQEAQVIVLCMAAGAVVRMIAPLLQNKSSDPAVIVVDAMGKYVISLIGGHQGKADQLTEAIAHLLGAEPVLTGMASSLGLPAVDIIGNPFGWQKGQGDWTAVSGAIARGEKVAVCQTVGNRIWQNHLSANHTFDFIDQPSNQNQSEYKAQVMIDWREPSGKSSLPQVYWHPKVLWIGIGCERGTSQILIDHAINQIFSEYHLAEGAIAGIATIDLKADEVGILEVCQRRNLPLRTFTANLLKLVPVPTPSTNVEAEVGTPSVAEAAAILASDFSFNHGLIRDNLDNFDKHQTEQALDSQYLEKLSDNLLVKKQIFRQPEQAGAVTIAVAIAPLEYTARKGKLILVGTGPGDLSQITPAAKAAINQADVLIGYNLYIDLITSLLRPGQIVERTPITQEKSRAERAIALANWGLTVVVVSSGDSGIYGMAGLVLETLQEQGWNGQTPALQVLPGISALQSAASKVGAPLMHDFCAISLSDLLTPWSLIIKRLEASAQADFVTAIYNPKSQQRTTQLTEAQKIFLQYRSPHTPVAIVHSAYRNDEKITLTTLEKLLDIEIDMLTVIIIGNQSTRIYENWMITPRGYLGFQ
jgi:cobalt-precorrin 5A hydrolase/precorrin-3B C17-methyltransferase